MYFGIYLVGVMCIVASCWPVITPSRSTQTPANDGVVPHCQAYIRNAHNWTESLQINVWTMLGLLGGVPGGLPAGGEC